MAVLSWQQPSPRPASRAGTGRESLRNSPGRRRLQTPVHLTRSLASSLQTSPRKPCLHRPSSTGRRLGNGETDATPGRGGHDLAGPQNPWRSCGNSIQARPVSPSGRRPPRASLSPVTVWTHSAARSPKRGLHALRHELGCPDELGSGGQRWGEGAEPDCL